jgi:thiamine biosynthesis lipoprotein
MKILLKTFSVFLFLQFGVTYCFAQTRHEFTHLQMGTQFRMVFYKADSVKAQRLADTCWERLDELNLVMSDYRSDSEVMQLCTKAEVGEWYSVSKDLFSVIFESQRAAEFTNGLFDISISPLTKLWRRARRKGVLPTKSQVDLARQNVGYQFFELNSASHCIRFLKLNIRLDLGGIGKGFALDELMKILKSEHVNSFLIEAGGSILLGDSPPDAYSWKINISDEEYSLSNCGISTSGDRFQFVEIDGRRYAHILDPRTGLGFHKPHEITIIASNTTIADWASTAVYLMDETELSEFLQKHLELQLIK